MMACLGFEYKGVDRRTFPATYMYTAPAAAATTTNNDDDKDIADCRLPIVDCQLLTVDY